MRVAQFVRILLPPSHWPFMVPMALSASCKKITARKIKIFYRNLERQSAFVYGTREREREGGCLTDCLDARTAQISTLIFARRHLSLTFTR